MNRRTRFSMSTNYALYYGHGQAGELSNYDIAVVEPAGQLNSLPDIKASGTLTIAYLSVMEVPAWSSDRDLLEADDFLHVKGKPYINPDYGNYWVNLASIRWQEILLQRVHTLIEGAGYDGVFLDTIGYIESQQLSNETRAALLKVAIEIVKSIRTQFPEHVLIQNCGLEELYRGTARYLDGICWENPPLQDHRSQEWADQVICNLEQVKKNYGLQILLLVEENNPCVKGFKRVLEVAKAKNFLVYYAPSFYTTGVSKLRL